MSCQVESQETNTHLHTHKPKSKYYILFSVCCSVGKKDKSATGVTISKGHFLITPKKKIAVVKTNNKINNYNCYSSIT